MVKGILFDLDGTLVDSLSTTYEAFNYGVTQFGGRAYTPQELTKFFGPGELEIFSLLVGRDKAQAAYQAARDYLDRNLGKFPLHEGIAELLEEIKSQKIPVSIVTGRSWNTTEMILNYHGLLDRFVTVVANDHVGHPKPSPEGIQLALSRMDLNPQEACYIGDSPVDILASRSAGTWGIAALWDQQVNRALLEAHQPHHWVSHPREVLQILE